MSGRKKQFDFLFYLLALVVLLAVAGMADSHILYKIHQANKAGTDTAFCSSGSGCDIVDHSPYSEFLGIPVSLFGFVFYLLVFCTVVFWRVLGPYAAKLLLLEGTVGLLVSLYLWYLMRFVIGAYCKYCLLSDAFSIGIFVLSVLIFKASTKNKSVKKNNKTILNITKK